MCVYMCDIIHIVVCVNLLTGNSHPEVCNFHTLVTIISQLTTPSGYMYIIETDIDEVGLSSV